MTEAECARECKKMLAEILRQNPNRRAEIYYLLKELVQPIIDLDEDLLRILDE